MTNSIEKEILFDVLNYPNDTFYENVLSDFLDEQGIEHDFRKQLHNNRIEKLKPYQEKCLDIWRNYWISVGLCTKPTDENKAEQYFYNFYKKLGFSKPENIVWFNNPTEIFFKLKLLTNKGSIASILNHSVYNKSCDIIHNIVDYPIIHTVENKCNLSTIDEFVSRINWHKIIDHEELYQCCYGQHDATWLLRYAYYSQVLRVKLPEQLIFLFLLAQEVNWWFPTRKTIYVVKKPKEYVMKDSRLIKLVYQNDYVMQ
jgi:hypothetical protein